MTTNSTLRIPVEADLTSSTADAFRQSMLPALAAVGTPESIEVDLRAARKIDSAGLNALVGLLRMAGKTPVTVLVGTSNVQRILLFARLDKHLRIEMR